MAIEWYEDNSMRITQTIVGSVDGATVTATIEDTEGEEVWTGALSPTGTDDEYSATVHPAAADLVAGERYRLRVEATYGGASLEIEAMIRPRLRRST